jgi:GNAT superfamily N-acetyltransferase
MADSDLPLVALLSAQLGYTGPLEHFVDRYHELAASGDHALFVAVADGAVVGWIHIRLHLALVDAPAAEVAALVVDAAQRGHGIGRSLMGKAEAWATDHGLRRIFLRSNVVRDDAHGFYARLGYEHTKTSHLFAKPLP